MFPTDLVIVKEGP